jgi:4-amino-4-deoxy-L-arabinose transferase-like glycosyltransferase
MNKHWQRWLPPALAAVVFTIFSLALLPLPGFEDDEVFFSVPLYSNGAEFSKRLFGHIIPLMAVNYYGALKAWIYAVIFSIAPPSRWSVRLPMVIVGIATIWLTWEWIRRIAGPRAAAFTVALLATDSIFILTNTFDWGPVALQHLLLAGGLVSMQLWLQRGDRRWLAVAFFLWGLGLWDKALMIWDLGGLAVAVICVYPRESWRALRSRTAGIAAIALIAGALPLIAFNVARHGATAVSNTHLALASVPDKLAELKAVFRGNVLFDTIIAATPGPMPRRPSTFLERASTAGNDQLGPYRTRPFVFALVVAGIGWLFLFRRQQARILALLAIASAVAWLQMAANTGTGGGAHHVILIWPLPCAFIGIALAGASERLPKYGRWAVVALVAWFTAANVLNTNTYLANLIRNGASTQWTDASERLAGAVSHYRNDPIVTVDWGYINGLRMFYGGGLQLIPIDEATPDRIAGVVPRSNAIFIQHTDDRQMFPGINERLRTIAAGLGYSEQSLRIVHDDEGRAIFEIFRLTKTR